MKSSSNFQKIIFLAIKYVQFIPQQMSVLFVNLMFRTEHYCVVGGMKPELQHPLSSQVFLHILTLNSYPKPAANPSYIQIVYHFSLCVVDDDIPQTFGKYHVRQRGMI